jgi:shikimate dehydrogenase
MGLGATRPRCGVLGDPVAHSLSPVLHRAAYAAGGLDWEYDAHEVPLGGLAGFLAGLGEEWRGLSLTMPLKREALGLGADASPTARSAGAANTLVRRDGDWWADNTDVPGARAALRERTDRELRTAVVLGGGATATSTGLALLELGVQRIAVAVREEARAAQTVAALRAHPSRPDVSVVPLLDAAALSCDVVVSTIPADAQTSALVERCADVPVVFEVLYDPWPTPLAAAAEGSGRVLVGGLDLLVHQAVLQFELFTGTRADVGVMRAAGASALRARSRS